MCLLTAFLQVKAFTVSKGKSTVRFLKVNAPETKIFTAFHSVSGTERFAKVKKIKQRGMGGVSPHVINTDLLEVTSYCRYVFAGIESNYASFLYCVDCKRGPPTVA
ncbi:MAG: hypothetical protein V4580_03365 [Bacteroidota bacterium]